MSSVAIYGQTYEVGLSLGPTSFRGDIGNSFIINPTDVGFGMVAKWNRSERHSFRFSASYLSVSENDRNSSNALQNARGFEFSNAIKELSMGIEYTWWEWNLHEDFRQSVPYLYTGIMGVSYGDLALSRDQTFKAFDNTFAVGIPMVVGFKTNYFDKLIFSFELGVRYLFADNLDGSAPDNLELPIENRLFFGNANSNDWYTFTAFTLTYTFGRKPCYCIF